MMWLSAQQLDALTEVVNIAFGRAAASLSELTDTHVIIKVPRVSVLSMGELRRELADWQAHEVAAVQQSFSGPVSGNAMLVFDYERAVALVSMLTDLRPPTNRLDAADREVLTEVGNILLNACLGTFGNLLQMHIRFRVPYLRVEALDDMLESLVIGTEELRFVVLVSTTFHLQDSEVSGHLLIVLGVSSLERLLAGIEALT